MVTNDLRNGILTSLGHPVVAVELSDEQLDLAVSRAINEVRPYITDTKLITVQTAQKIDLSSYHVSFITHVYKVPESDISRDPFSFTGIVVSDDANVFQLYEQGLMDRIIGSVREDLSYMWDDPYLYLDTGYPSSTSVTIEYVPIYETADQINNPVWENTILNFAIAFAKEMLGRIRSKHSVSSSPIQLDGNTLLSESSSELANLRQKLKEESDSFFPEG